ncbi:tyrosine phosphatase family-domain-containing protein, partial [Obelidium mucronatum]
MIEKRKEHHPPFRYGLVASSPIQLGAQSVCNNEVFAETLSRGAFPLQTNIRFLSRLNLKTIISLTPDVPMFHSPGNHSRANSTATEPAATAESTDSDPVRVWVTKSQIKTIHIRVDRPTDDNEIPLSFKQAASILAIITNKENMPAYIHCLNGGVVTGLVCALLRKLMHWSPKSAIAEYARFLAGEEIDGTGVHEFVDRFSGEVEISQSIPKWLWGGMLPTKKHPSIKLKLLQAPPPVSATTLPSTNSAPQSLPSPKPSTASNFIHQKSANSITPSQRESTTSVSATTTTTTTHASTTSAPAHLNQQISSVSNTSPPAVGQSPSQHPTPTPASPAAIFNSLPPAALKPQARQSASTSIGNGDIITADRTSEVLSGTGSEFSAFTATTGGRLGEDANGRAGSGSNNAGGKRGAGLPADTADQSSSGSSKKSKEKTPGANAAAKSNNGEISATLNALDLEM